MRRIIFGILVCMLLIGTAIPISGSIKLENNSSATLIGNTLYVGGSGEDNYSKIQDAIDAANHGDKILVCCYSSPYEENLEIDKQITLEGLENVDEIPCIDGKNYGGYTIKVTEDNVVIKNFNIYNTKEISENPDIAVIKMINSSLSEISNNLISISENEEHGIFFKNSHLNNISGNNIVRASGEKVCIGISLKSSHLNNITRNTISDCKIGINIDGKCFLNQIYKNDAISDNDVGVAILNCKAENLIHSNNINNNINGILVDSSEDINIINNVIEYNTDNGIKMISTRYCSVSNNTICNNKNTEKTGSGIHVKRKIGIIGNNYFKENKIVENDYGIYLLDCNRDYIEENNISINNLNNIYLLNTISIDIRANIIKDALDETQIYNKGGRFTYIRLNNIINTFSKANLLEGSGIVIAPRNYWEIKNNKVLRFPWWKTKVLGIFIAFTGVQIPYDYSDYK